MEVSNLIEISRNLLHDTKIPYLWSDAELESYIDEAQKEACFRANVLIDATDNEICKIPISPNVNLYKYSPYIINIFEVKLASSKENLQKIIDLDKFKEEVGFPPTHYSLSKHQYIEIYPTPNTSDILEMVVSRIPKRSVVDAPLEIPEIHRTGLLDWVLFRAYMKQDAETYDTDKAQLHLSMFVANFGEKPTVKTILNRKKYAMDLKIRGERFETG
jgi:hypothetical protein